ncbi:MAG: response regulator [Myxococcota bacterium]
MIDSLLLVEDDDLDRAVIHRALTDSGLSVEIDEASTVAEAREALSTKTYHCILSDLSLPDGEGVELIPLAASSAFVVLTGTADERVRAVLDQGAQDYLLKDRMEPYWLGRAIEYAVERKRLQLFQREAEHQDRLASLGQLAASVAHEINNPTAFVAANIELIESWTRQIEGDELRKEETLQALSDCASGLERIARIVRQLRSFARHPSEIEPVAKITVADVANWSAALTRTQVAHVARFERDIAEDGHAFAGRPGRLSQVLTNLIINASQAVSGAAGRAVVRLTAKTTERHAVFLIEDSGPGLTEEMKKQVFRPFFTTKPAGQGTGLGLPVAREIVREHGGELTLLDSPLGGLKAVVRIPLANGLTPIQVTGDGSVDSPTSPLSLLVVDDEPALRRAYARLLRPHRVTAFDAPEALEWLADEENAASIDAVICDVMMPDLDGRAVYEAAKNVAPRLADRFVFCSGGVFRSDLKDFLRSLPGSPVLLKPVNRDAILAAVARVLDLTR